MKQFCFVTITIHSICDVCILALMFLHSGWNSPHLKGPSQTHPNVTGIAWTQSWTAWPASFRFQMRSPAVWTNSPYCVWASVTCVLRTSSQVRVHLELDVSLFGRHVSFSSCVCFGMQEPCLNSQGREKVGHPHCRRS